MLRELSTGRWKVARVRCALYPVTGATADVMCSMGFTRVVCSTVLSRLAAELGRIEWIDRTLPMM